MQTYLEEEAIKQRGELTQRNDYVKENEYSRNHPDALSTGDPQGKGSAHGGHTHTTPDRTKGKAINYSNFDTEHGGGLYDIEGKNGIGGRNFLKNISLYNEGNQYGLNLIDTSLNDGQVRL